MSGVPPSPYVNTPVSPDDEASFVDGVYFATRSDLYKAEEEAIAEYSAALFEAILAGDVSIDDLLKFEMLLDIHAGCYGSVWKWAGQIRTKELNLGSEPAYIRENLSNELGNFEFWVRHQIGSPEWIAINAHHRTVKIHPFVDGNGRATRIYADAILLSLTRDQIFEWSIDPAYYQALRAADLTMDAKGLLDLIKTQSIG